MPTRLFAHKILDLALVVFSNIYFKELPIQTQLTINLGLSFGYLLFGIMLRIVVQLFFIILFQISLMLISGIQIYFFIDFMKM